ncbi:MAG TPA: SAM-dependent methyltransferase [Candidatus Acidoferrales bacterium]|jgi:methyltransferase (TIGR00027 family)|nr:SAM-dependent methyltransferase [Candidatus Acidoferrales bacterium]
MNATNAGKEALIRNISDTALWVAVYRARENERPDALFRDPYARKLAGDRGEQIAKLMQSRVSHEWPYIARTVRVDQIVREQIQQGVDLVVNLAAGLDTRPYTMEVPPSLQWVEVDLPAMIAYKEEELRNEKPHCKLRRVALDLADVPARRKLFQELGGESKRALVISEGLIVYLTRDEVLALASDLAAQPAFHHWVLDLASPGLLKMLQKELPALKEAGSPLKFGPEEGPEFFLNAGWKPVEVYSMLKTASKLRRLPSLMLRFFALLPESNGRQGSRPWSGVCRLTRIN